MRAIKLLLATAFVAVGGFAAAATLTSAPQKAQAAPNPCNYIVVPPERQLMGVRGLTGRRVLGV